MNKDLEEFLKTRKRPTVLLGPLERALMLQQRSSDRRTDVLHPSEITKADWCIRQSWFLLRGAEKPAERLGLRMRSIFAEGHAIHAKWQSWLEDAGFLLGEWECPACADAWWGTPEGGCGCGGHTYKEVPVVDDDLHVLGHADGWVRVPDQPDALLEIKGLALDTPLPTPTGWTTMGRAEVGDQLIGSDGTPCRVIGKSAVKKIGTYVVTFDTGERIVCDSEHLWWTFSGYRKNERVVPVAEVAATLRRSNGQVNHLVPLVLPLDLPVVSLPVDPYLLGVWLGDGTYRNGSAFICSQQDVMDVLRERGTSLGNDNGKKGTSEARTAHGLVTGLKELGLVRDGRHAHSPERWIPQQYLRASREQRLDLLRGLMDTDGTAGTGGRKQVQFTTVSKELAENVRELVLSLGQRPYLIEVPRKGFGVSVTSYDVRWTPVGVVPFLLERKRAATVVRAPLTTKGTRRAITSVVPGPDVETQCVSVDSPNRTYLCGEGMIPTHNSIGIGTIRSMGGRISGGLASSFGMIDRPYSPHVRQAMFYLYILRRMYEKGLIEDVPPERIVFIYECKEDQAAKEFVVEYDEEWIAGVLMKLDELRLAKGTPPCTGDTASDGYCDQCRSYV